MKIFAKFFVFFVFSISVFSQAPEKMSYQAVVRNSEGELIKNSLIGIRISIVQGSFEGEIVYQEKHTPESNINGLITLEIGAGEVTQGTFSTIEWADGSYFIKTEIDPNGFENYSITSNTQMLSVPYALHAKTAESLTTSEHSIGELYGGGIIFHLWRDIDGNERGLIVSLEDLSTAQAFSNVDSTEIGPSARSTWDGKSNTEAIVNQEGHIESAASLCQSYNAGGYNDWYLPSIDELNLLYNSRFNVNKSIKEQDTGSEIGQNIYWSSTEFDINSAWYFIFSQGFNYFGTSGYRKNSTRLYVRAIREF